MAVSPHPYRIGIDARFLRSATGGIGRYTRELLRGLAKLDTYNEYFVFITPEDASEWLLEAVNFHPVVVHAPIFSKEEQTVLLKALRAHRLDLVHFLNFNHPVLYRGTFVTTLHDLIMYNRAEGRSQRSFARRTVFRAIFRRSLTAARKVIAVSEFSAKDAEATLGISQAKMEVVLHGGPDPVELPFGSKAVVQDFLGTRSPYFLFIDQWRPHKGIITLIEAFGVFKKATGLAHVLVLAGKQSAAPDSVKTALENSPYRADIITPGFAPDELLPGLYKHATAYIKPSEYEGFGLQVLEAYMHGAPVISADNSSLPEVVGDGGLLFPTGNAEALAQAMERFATEKDLPAALAPKARDQLRKFSWETTARQTHAVYMSILEKAQ